MARRPRLDRTRARVQGRLGRLQVQGKIRHVAQVPICRAEPAVRRNALLGPLTTDRLCEVDGGTRCSMMRIPTVDRARGRWREILPCLGVETRYLTNKHGPCPLCGGKDRFRFDDKNGDGTYYCNQCGA